MLENSRDNGMVSEFGDVLDQDHHRRRGPRSVRPDGTHRLAATREYRTEIGQTGVDGLSVKPNPDGSILTSAMGNPTDPRPVGVSSVSKEKVHLDCVGTVQSSHLHQQVSRGTTNLGSVAADTDRTRSAGRFSTTGAMGIVTADERRVRVAGFPWPADSLGRCATQENPASLDLRSHSRSDLASAVNATSAGLGLRTSCRGHSGLNLVVSLSCANAAALA